MSKKSWLSHFTDDFKIYFKTFQLSNIIMTSINYMKTNIFISVSREYSEK